MRWQGVFPAVKMTSSEVPFSEVPAARRVYPSAGFLVDFSGGGPGGRAGVWRRSLGGGEGAVDLLSGAGASTELSAAGAPEPAG